MRQASGGLVGATGPVSCLLVLARSTARGVGRQRRADHAMGEILDRAGQHVRVGGGAAQPDHYHEKPAGQLDRTSGTPPGGRAAGRLAGQPVRDPAGEMLAAATERLNAAIAATSPGTSPGSAGRPRPASLSASASIPLRGVGGQRLSVEDHVQQRLVQLATGPAGEVETRHLA